MPEGDIRNVQDSLRREQASLQDVIHQPKAEETSPVICTSPTTGRKGSLLQEVRFHSFVAAVIFVLSLLAALVVGDLVANLSLIFLVFLCATLGGIVNTYFRLNRLPVDFQKYESSNVNTLAIIQVYASPVVSGALGLIFYGFFIAGMVQGTLFPEFTGTDQEYVSIGQMFSVVEPKNNNDATKAMFWALVAGFSEYLVPNIIDRMSSNFKENAPAVDTDASHSS
jgi:hypothetical protein